jgi:phage baseplate assembly protein V
MIDAMRRAMGPLARSIGMMVGRGVVQVVDDAGGCQLVQLSLLYNELRDQVERMQEYGFTSNPLPGAEAVMVCVGGERAHGLIVALGDRRFRLKALQPGEVALYTDEGDKIVLKREHNIEIDTGTLTVNATTKVIFNTPRAEFTGDVIDQTGSGNAHTVAVMRQIHNNHLHPGVQVGGGNTAVTLQTM